jgi:hypothetical protein
MAAAVSITRSLEQNTLAAFRRFVLPNQAKLACMYSHIQRTVPRLGIPGAAWMKHMRPRPAVTRPTGHLDRWHRVSRQVGRAHNNHGLAY